MIILGINKSNIVRTNYNKKYIIIIYINNFVHNNEKENINKN